MDFEYLIHKINTLPYDIKAEAILAPLLDSINKSNYDLILESKGQFERSYSKDMLGCKVVDNNDHQNKILKIDLSRDGIYDILPEGIYHYPKNQKPNQSVGDMTQEYHLQKKEESHARRFFSPFENEFFLYGMINESKENNTLLALNGNEPLDFFYDFWEISREFPKKLIYKFMRLLPFVHQIVGKLELTSRCLNLMLEEEVEIINLGYKVQADSGENSCLGNCKLGIDMISGSFYTDYSLHLEFRIGPLKNSSIIDYLHDGQINKFIKLFYDFFLPTEFDAKTKILLQEEEQLFDFNERPILGITTKI